jgi:hypothetical protein
MAGWQDWNIARFAFENDYVVVTNNRRDFLREYLKFDLHCGLAVIVPNVDRQPQIELFNRLLDFLDPTNGDPTNLLIEITLDGSIHSQPWTKADHDIGHIGNPSWLAS